jgi:hypothetical protein
MKSSRLFEFGFLLAGLLAGIAMGIWTSLCFFYGHDGILGQRVAAGFVIAGIILNQVLRFRFRSQNKDDEKPDAF